MLRRLDYEAMYSPENRTPAQQEYDDRWQVAESAKFYQKQVSQLKIPSRQEVDRQAYRVQLGLECQDKLEFIDWAEIDDSEDYASLVELVKDGKVAQNELVVGHLRLVAHIARLTMGWVPFGTERRNGSHKVENDELDDQGLTKRPPKPVFKGNILLDLSVLKNYPTTLEDRIQMGTEGLFKAAEKYKPGKNSFANYAWWWIESLIISGIQKDKIISVPAGKEDSLRLYGKVESALMQELGRKASKQEVVEAIGQHALIFLEETTNAMDVASIDQLDKRITDRTDASQDELVEQIMREEAADQVLEELPERLRDILALRYGFVGGEPLTLEEVGGIFGVTRERIRQLENDALKELATKSIMWGWFDSHY